MKLRSAHPSGWALFESEAHRDERGWLAETFRLDALRAHSAGDGAESETAALFAGFCDAAERSVQTLRERVSPGDIDAAAALLARAETIYLIAQRRSFPISTYMSYAFGKLGIRTVLVGSAQGTDEETLAFAGPRDAAIAVSFTPYASSTLAFAL